MGRPRSILRLVLAFALAATLAACASQAPTGTAAGGSGASASASPTEAAFPVTVHGTNGDITIDERPARIVSLSPTATEDLFAIGARDQVTAVDDQSSYPSDAPRTKLPGFEPNIEAIAGYQPDLVVYAAETAGLGPSLDALGITALQLDAAKGLADVYEQIEQLGLATGRMQAAQALVAQIKAELRSRRSWHGSTRRRVRFCYELDDTFYSVTSKTFIGQLFRLLELERIADAAGRGSGGYPQLSAEYIIRADPDLIFLADTKCCGQSPKTVAARPGWDQIRAVRDGGVIPLDDDVASRWGPRVVDLLRAIAAAATERGW